MEILAKFTAEQAHAVVEIQELINDWGYELDVDNGRNIADLVTEDVVYAVRGGTTQGRAGVVKFYADRLTQLSAGAGVPTHRHSLANLRVVFSSATDAAIFFNLTYFSTMGQASGAEHADPAAYADVRMKVRRDPDGHWRIALFDSNQVFRRVIK
jgi:ketosteroid isomerase-like protein